MEIHVVWGKVGDLSGERRNGSENPLKNGKASDIGKACRSSNVAIRGLLSNEIFTEAVPIFLGNIGAGTIKEGAVPDKG